MHKPSKFLSIARDLAKRSYQSLRREASLSWQFIGRDISTTIIPGVLFMVAAWNSHPSSFGELLLTIGRGTLYFWLYIVPFCISNQIDGIEEDRLNKPDRPLVTGAVSLEGAKIRLAVSMVLFTLIGWGFGVLPWTLLWQACIVAHNFGGWSKYWFGKNFVMGVGVIAQLAAAWQMVMPIDSSGWRWILLLAGVWLCLASVQDLRDIEGDRAIGRKTMPIVFGETVSRIILCAGFVLLPFVTHLLVMTPAGQTWNVILCDILQAIISAIVAMRILFHRSPKADRRTYMLFTYWYCYMLFSAIIVL